MKSAYELAMERLREEDPEEAVTLSEEQKAALEKINQEYEAKIAERKVFLDKRLTEARQSGDEQAIEQINKQIRYERERLEAERDAEKEKIRQAARENS